MSDDEEPHPGLETLEKCEEQVTITIRNNLGEIARFLRDKGVVNRKLYGQVTDPTTRETEDARATMVYSKLTGMVEENDGTYLEFVGYLRKKSKYKKTVDKLDKVYAEKVGHGQNVREPLPPVQPGTPAPIEVQDDFSRKFSPSEFAEWMKKKKYLSEDNCKAITESGISGLVFMELAESDLKEYGFVSSGFFTMRGVLKEVKKTNSDSIAVTDPMGVPPLSGVDESSVSSDGFRKDQMAQYPAMDRGTYIPKLMLESGDSVAKLNAIEKIKIPELAQGYYPMESMKHGVCLIINNKTFKDHKKREGTDRDEHNLVETWRYLGYHVEVRREATFRKIVDIFCDIDDMLKDIKKTTKVELAHDSFVCCILSHGNNFCIYSTDGKEVPIDYMEKSLGESLLLGGRPKIFFIQACQGSELGTRPITTKLYVPKKLQPDGAIQSDSEIQTSKRTDIYISYATAQGAQSFRHIEKGSWFIGAVCRTLCEESKQTTLDQLQKSINKKVVENNVFVTGTGAEYKQQPSASDQLNSNVHFFHQSTS